VRSLGLIVALLLGADDAPVLVDVTKVDSRIALDLRYATADNFAHTVLYSEARCLLRPDVAQMLKRAQDALSAAAPGNTLLLKDCYRPVSVQRKLFDVVKGTSSQGYVADPNSAVGSVHTYGCAVDLTMRDPKGHEVDMGTPYDFLGALAQPRFEPKFLKTGQLTPLQVKTRKVLRKAMQTAGFKTIRNEWWHFDALQGSALRARYQPLDLPLTVADPSTPLRANGI